MINEILCLSDTHGRHRLLRELPDADMVVHCGDFTEIGTEDEALDFLEWFCDLPYRHKIFTLGNHDECLFGADIEGLDSNVHFLCNTGIEIEGVKFYAVPFFIEGFGDSPADKIPHGTDMVIMHQPPYGILDKTCESGYGEVLMGSESLMSRIAQVKPGLCVFGHVHQRYGISEQDGTVFVNASILKEDGGLNMPILLDMKMCAYCL